MTCPTCKKEMLGLNGPPACPHCDRERTVSVPLDAVDCSPSAEVPFSDLPRRDITLHDGIGCACPNGSIIEVWKIKDEDGFHIKLRRKLEDGRMSLLKFGMSLEAATALVGVLQMQIYPEENVERIRGDADA